MATDCRTILLVDDDEGIRDALGELLRDEGFTVESVANGHEALRWLTETRPACCVILLDLMMTVMDGRELLERKQADPGLAAYPVLVITASANPAGFARTPDVKGCLAKPIDPGELMAALARCGASAEAPSGSLASHESVATFER